MNCHMVIVARNYNAMRKLNYMISVAHQEGFYYKPRVDYEVLEQFHEGIIALSACLAGEVARFLTRGMYEDAKAAALRYQDIFGNILEAAFFSSIRQIIQTNRRKSIA